MKISYITDTVLLTRAANAIQSIRMCEALSALGHTVTLYCGRGKKYLSPDELVSFYGIDNDFVVKFIYLPPRRFKSGKFAMKLVKKIKRNEVDLIITRHLYSAFVFTLRGDKVIYEVHKSPAIDGKVSRYIFKRLIRLKKFKKVVAISQSLKEDLIHNFQLKEDQIIVAHDSAKAGPAIATTTVIHNSNEVNIGYLGSNFVGKGIKTTVALASRCPTIRFHIIGSSLDEVRKQIEFPVPVNIVFHGFINPAETINHLSKMDILIAPFERKVLDISGREITKWMSPLKIFEYMAAKKPIIASNLEVIREVLKDGENALMCEPENIQQWVDTLQKLAQNNQLKEQLANNAYQSFLSHHTWERRAQRILLDCL